MSEQEQLFPTPSEAPEGPYKVGWSNRSYTGAKKRTRNPRYAKPIMDSVSSRHALMDRRDEVKQKHALVSTQQFSPITALMESEANDFIPHSVGGVHRYYYSHEGRRAEEFGNYDMDALHQDIAREGITKPLWVVPHEDSTPENPQASLINGHHRAMVAIDQNHMFVPTTEKYNGYDKPTYRRW